MNKLITLIILTLIAHTSAKAQIAIGTWRDHLPFHKTIQITDAGDKMFCCTGEAIFSYDKDDSSLEKVSKVNGLSDVGISSINYDSSTDALLIGYTNGNIDLIKNNSIYNIADIKRKQITGADKRINNILFIDDFAYLSCGFGMVVVDIDKIEIKDTYFIGENSSRIAIFEIAFDGTNLIAATEEGIYRGEINNPNLVDFNNWKKDSTINNFDGQFDAITIFNNKIYVNFDDNSNDTIFVYDNNKWDYLDTSLSSNHFSLAANDKNLIITAPETVYILSSNESIQKIELPWGLSGNDAIPGNPNEIWMADKSSGLVRIANNAETQYNIYRPNGPRTKFVFNLSAHHNQLWVAPSGYKGSFVGSFKDAEAYSFIDETWEYNPLTEAGSMQDVAQVLINPLDPDEIYLGTWGYGIVKLYKNEVASVYNDNNSTLQNIPGQTSGYIRINGMALDSENNLWVSNLGAPFPLSVKKNDNTWKSFKFSSISNKQTGEIIITQNNHKWIALEDGQGIFVFDDNATIDDGSDDQTKLFGVNDENGNTISNEIASIAEDKEGTIWVGTNQGIAAYFNPENVFSGNNFYAQRIIIDLDGTAQYLLETETVTAIAIDGANRKWFGTQSAGVFLMSEDGTEQILNFSANNSPLLSNNIIDIAIDHQTGEVYFGTEAGIISYRGTSTAGEEIHSEVYAYPNPVRKDYDGLIGIKGLVTNANVKITDINGNIVYETTADGGQAVWNARDFSGNRVRTGIYLVFITDEEGEQTHVTKILVEN